jgi:hypothetical protein
VRYNLCNIKLLAIAKSEYLNQLNTPALLENFIEGVNKLNSSGLELMVNSKLKRVFGLVLIGLGDTLALQEMGGFVVGVGKAYKFCRSCEINAEEKLEDPSNIYVERDIERHLLQLELIKESPELIQEYGVKYPSALLKLNDFDVCQCLLHDPMHVLVQGVCVKELTNLLKYLTEERGTKLDEINRRITSFDYPRIDSTDKPNTIKKEHVNNGSFAQSAGQMLTLILQLPFMVADLVTEFDKYWLNFINLHQIVNLVFCFFYNELTINQLEERINEYLSNFKHLYKDVNFTPKMHYLSHFPAQLANFGLLRLHSCFRFEAKNGLLADLRFHNFINIAFSCANKHQFWIGSKEIEFKKRNSLAYHDDICDINKNSIIEDIHHDHLKPKKYISDIKYLKLNGFKYYPGSFLIINLLLNIDSLSVAYINKILNVDGNYFFYLQIFKIKDKIKKLNCLEISPTQKYIYLKYDDLEYRQINFSVTWSSKILLPVRYFYNTII